MSADLLRRAAKAMREDAELGHTWSGPWRPAAALAVADLLDIEAQAIEEGITGAFTHAAFALAHSYLREVET